MHMTLKDIIADFLSEDYEFFKYNDKDGNSIMVYMRFNSHREFFQQYMKYYREQPSLSSLLKDATLGIIRIEQADNKTYYIRHPHQEVFTDKEGNQRGINVFIAKQVEHNLQARIEDLKKCSNFSQVIKIVEECKVKGFGDLSIYDTAVRIGTYLGIEPDKVYLHAGTRVGIKQLEEKGYLVEGSSKRKTIGLNEMPKEFGNLSADEIQHFACSKKSDLEYKLEPKQQLFLTKGTNQKLRRASESAMESTQMYRVLKDVSKVATQRGLSIVTIYKHLFQTGELNPHDFITNPDYQRASEILESGCANEYEDELNKIFTIEARTAYYYIKRNEPK